MPWAAIVFGWPSAFGAIAIGWTGLVMRSAIVMLLGGVIGLGFMTYLSGAPAFWPLAVLAVACYFGAAAAMWRRRTRLAWLLFLPTPLLTVYFIGVVLGLLQPPPSH
jgi:hypothetical protein